MRSEDPPIRVLFVCVENSCRSQMAEAFARMYQPMGGQRIEAHSAGSKPSGIVNAKAIASLKELGYDLTKHGSKSLDDIRGLAFDAVVTMGCGDACPWVPAQRREDWRLEDPKHLEMDEFRKSRDEIARRVKALLDELTAE
mgnify:CR=1 FL=1